MNRADRHKADRRARRLCDRRAVVVERQVADARKKAESEYVEFARAEFGGRDPRPLSRVTMRILGMVVPPLRKRDAA